MRKKALHVAGLAAIKTLGPGVAKEVLSLAATAAAQLALGDKGTERLRELVSTVGDAAGDLTKDKIKEYVHQKETLAAFRKALKDFAAVVHGNEEGSAEDRFLPLVFIIDELDRCRPTYAIELLETLKHLFAVPGVVFVLGINQDVLSQSFQAVYGPNFPGALYLRRFIDLIYTLPKPSLAEFCSELSEELIPEFDAGIQPQFPYYQWAGYGATVPYRKLSVLVGARYGSMFRRSLRDLEQIFSRAGAALGTLAEGQQIEPAYFFFLLLLQDAEPELYASFRDGKPHQLPNDLVSKYGIKLTDKDSLDVIVSEALHSHHLSGEEWRDRRSRLLEALQKTGNQSDITRYGLLAHDRTRLTDTTKVVDLAQRFDSGQPRGGR